MDLPEGNGPAFELASDPLEGTGYCASASTAPLRFLAVGPPGSIWATSGYCMDKLIVGPGANGTVDVNAPLDQNLDRVSEAPGKDVSDLVVVVLAKPRHEEVIAEIRGEGGRRARGPGRRRHGLRVLLPNGGADLAPGVAARQKE